MIRPSVFISALISAFIVFSDASYAASDIEGEVSISFDVESVTPFESFIEVSGTGIKAYIDSTGHFKLLDVPNGMHKLSVFLWDSTLIRDTILHITSHITDFSWSINFDCAVNKFKAYYDLKYGIANLFLVGSIAPAIFEDDIVFEREYNIRFFDFGCVPPKTECITGYNHVIISHLDHKHGLRWRLEVRQDVIGLGDRKL